MLEQPRHSSGSASPHAVQGVPVNLDSIAGDGLGQRHLNGPQTTGREYRNLSEPGYQIVQELDRGIPVRDGTTLMADVFMPDTD